MRNHCKTVDVSKSTAKVTLLSGADKHEVEPRASSDKLEAKGGFKVATGTKAVAQVNVAGKSATARFILK